MATHFTVVILFMHSEIMEEMLNKNDTDGATEELWKVLMVEQITNINFYNYNYNPSSSDAMWLRTNGVDWVSVGNHGSGTNNMLTFGARNGNNTAGDYIRILVVPNSNSNPVAVNDTDSITEGATEDVKSDGSFIK